MTEGRQEGREGEREEERGRCDDQLLRPARMPTATAAGGVVAAKGKMDGLWKKRGYCCCC